MGLGPPGVIEEVTPEPGIGSAEVLQQALDCFPRREAKRRLPRADDLPQRGVRPDRNLHRAILVSISPSVPSFRDAKNA